MNPKKRRAIVYRHPIDFSRREAPNLESSACYDIKKTPSASPRSILQIALSVVLASSMATQAQEPPIRHAPSWYSGSRYQAHAKLWIGEDSDPDPSNPHSLDHPLFWTAADEYVRLGVGAHTRHIKSEGEDAIWPTAVGNRHYLSNANQYGGHPVYGNNLAQRIIDASKDKGLRIILYYLPTVDDLWNTNPAWRVTDQAGNFPRQHNRGYYISLAPAGYKNFLKTRVEELITMGADGVYFDHDHVPKTFDFSAAGEAKCQQMFGQSMSQINNVQREEVRQQIIKDGYDPIVESIRAINPESLMIISTNGVRLDFYKNGAVPKTEPGFRTKMGGTQMLTAILRDASDGRSPHVWYKPQDTYPDDAELGRYLAWGAIGNRHIPEGRLANTPQTEDTHVASQLVMGEHASNALVDTTPHSWALVHVNDQFIPGNMDIRQGSTSDVKGAFDYFMGKHIPVGAILDWQLRASIPAECELLVLSQWNENTVPTDLQPSINAFVNRGGTVVYKSQVATMNSVVSALTPDIQEVGGGHGNLDLVAYHGITEKRLVLALADGNFQNVEIFLSDKYQPTSATNVINGGSLTITPVTGGNIIELPSCNNLGLISIPYTDNTGTPGGSEMDAVIEAENFDGPNDGSILSVPGGTGGKMGHIHDGDWAVFNQFNFATSPESLDISMTSLFSGTVELRLDSVTGPILGTLSIGSTGGWENFQTFNATLAPMAPGTRDLYMVFSGNHSNGLVAIDWFRFNSATYQPTAYEAENATISSPSEIKDRGYGWNGTGYVDLSEGGFVEWTITVPTAGNYDLDFNAAGIANGIAAEIRVNGAVVNAGLPFANTGSWNASWQVSTVPSVSLNAGANIIRLTDSGVEQPHIDQLMVR